jgi:hypothetical protein
LKDLRREEFHSRQCPTFFGPELEFLGAGSRVGIVEKLNRFKFSGFRELLWYKQTVILETEGNLRFTKDLKLSSFVQLKFLDKYVLWADVNLASSSLRHKILVSFRLMRSISLTFRKRGASPCVRRVMLISRTKWLRTRKCINLHKGRDGFLFQRVH